MSIHSKKFAALVLAAGRGSRMKELTEQQHKSKVKLHGKSLIDWQLEALSQTGIVDIAIIRGYLGGSFVFDIPYFENDRWSETNMVRSLMMAQPWLESRNCIVSYSDIVYKPSSVSALQRHDGDIVIAYDPNWLDLWSLRFEDPLSDAETFQIDGGVVREIGKKTDRVEDICGQYMGLLKFTPIGWSKVMMLLDSKPSDEIDKMDMTSMLSQLIDSGVVINGVPISDKWYEIDSQQDLEVYQSLHDLWN